MIEFVSPKEFANIMGVSERTVKSWVKTKSIPSVRVGQRLIRIPREEGIKGISNNLAVK